MFIKLNLSKIKQVLKIKYEQSSGKKIILYCKIIFFIHLKITISFYIFSGSLLIGYSLAGSGAYSKILGIEY